MPFDTYFSTIRGLAEYETWCNTEAFDAAVGLTREQLFQRFPFGFGTIHRTLHHTLAVFEHWSGFVLPEVEDRPWEEYSSEMSIDEMRRRNAELSSRFLEGIDAAHAQGLLDADRRLVQVFHLVTHGTHHRTQFISMLRMLGVDPPLEPGDFAGWERTGGRHR